MQFTTADEAKEAIVQAIEGTGVALRDEYDIDTIYDKVVTIGNATGYGNPVYTLMNDTDLFWAAVEANAKLS